METDTSQQGTVRVESTDGPTTSSSSNQSSDVYKLDHGTAIIFNQNKFNDGRERQGSDKDCEDLERALKERGFEVKVHHDLTRVDFEKTLEKARDEDHTENDCILIAIMSHGQMNSIETFDSYLGLDTITKIINDSETLKNKPKIFIIQACRGTCTKEENDGPADWGVSQYEDFLVAYSTVADHVSLRDLKKGSHFIQALVEVFDANLQKQDLQEMLLHVKEKVEEKVGGKQICCTFETLKRKVYLKKKDATAIPQDETLDEKRMQEKLLEFVLAVAAENIRRNSSSY